VTKRWRKRVKEMGEKIKEGSEYIITM